jgi:predicted nucleotidyltransferase component of viral defense system
MNLHNDKLLFGQSIQMTSQKLGITENIVEKDYFVTLFLKELTGKLPNLVFKGGTSLSKCYKLINRFSEDIDLTLNVDKATEGVRKGIKNAILAALEELGLTLNNPDFVRSRRDFNRYEVLYPSVFSSELLKPFLYVETAVYIRSFPNETLFADCFIYEYLKGENRNDLIEQYDLMPFEINVQHMDRTFIDKVFALGDYYLDGKVRGHSRHLYDLHKLYPKITFDDKFRALTAKVREIRKPHKTCYSAQDGIDIPELLLKIMNENYYQQDYNNLTAYLLFDHVTYTDTLKTLQAIIDSGMFA